MVSILPFISRYPRSNAYAGEILPGQYLTNHNTKNCNYITSNWTVTSGDPIDIFLLTLSQYNDWNRTLLPTYSLFLELGSFSGEFNMSLNTSTTYYIVFSNINGSASSFVELETYFYNCRASFDFPVLLIGLLILVCQIGLISVYYAKKRFSEPEKESPISRTKFTILFVIVSFVIFLILNFLLDDFLLEILIVMNIILPISAVVFIKYF